MGRACREELSTQRERELSMFRGPDRELLFVATKVRLKGAGTQSLPDTPWWPMVRLSKQPGEDG